MRAKNDRALPAAFAVGAAPDSPAWRPGVCGWQTVVVVAGRDYALRWRMVPERGKGAPQLLAAQESGRSAMFGKATLDHPLRPEGLIKRRLRQWRGASDRRVIWGLPSLIRSVLIISGFQGVLSGVSLVMNSPGPSITDETNSGNSRARMDAEFFAGLAEAFRCSSGVSTLTSAIATAAQRASDLAPCVLVGEHSIYPRAEAPASAENHQGSVWKCPEWWALASVGLTAAAALVQLAAVVLTLCRH